MLDSMGSIVSPSAIGGLVLGVSWGRSLRNMSGVTRTLSFYSVEVVFLRVLHVAVEQDGDIDCQRGS